MATLQQLKSAYLCHNQSDIEDAWSSRWGGTHHQWRKTIYPRVSRFLPTDSILEIGCGRGMLSQHLMRYTRTLTLVDFIDTRQQQLLPAVANDAQVNFYHNDGMTLNKIADKSVDFAFSFFSLIDANNETIESYIEDLNRVLTKNGVAFIHHSNALPEPGQQLDANLFANMSRVRAADVNAQVVRKIANTFNFEARVQECVAWAPGTPLMDCFTTLTRPSNVVVKNIGQFDNLYFEDEVRYGISDLSTNYGSSQNTR